MKPEQQRIAIAEACGWKMFCQEAVDGNWGTKDKWITAPDGTSQFRHDIPDYLNDLNAMHEAEKTLGDSEHYIYREILYKMFNPHTCRDWRVVVSATSAQRAEAFLRTIGKWRGMKPKTPKLKRRTYRGWLEPYALAKPGEFNGHIPLFPKRGAPGQRKAKVTVEWEEK